MSRSPSTGRSRPQHGEPDTWARLAVPLPSLRPVAASLCRHPPATDRLFGCSPPQARFAAHILCSGAKGVEEAAKVERVASALARGGPGEGPDLAVRIVVDCSFTPSAPPKEVLAGAATASLRLPFLRLSAPRRTQPHAHMKAQTPLYAVRASPPLCSTARSSGPWSSSSSAATLRTRTTRSPRASPSRAGRSPLRRSHRAAVATAGACSASRAMRSRSSARNE